MDNKKIIGTRINSALALSGKLQKDLAAVLGVTDNTVSYYVGGKRSPSTEQLIEIAKYLGVTSDYLLGLSDTPSPDIEDQAICKKLGIDGETLEALIKVFGAYTGYVTRTGTVLLVDSEGNSNREKLEIIKRFIQAASNSSTDDLKNFFEKVCECVQNRVKTDELIAKRDNLLNKIKSELSEKTELIITEFVFGIKTDDMDDYEVFEKYKDDIQRLCDEVCEVMGKRDLTEYRLKKFLENLLLEITNGKYN